MTKPIAQPRLLLLATGLLAAQLGAVAAAAEPDTGEAPAATPVERVDLRPGPAIGRIDRVTVELEVGGHLLQPRNPDDRTGPTTEAPMSVEGELDYDERRLAVGRSARYYHTAKATLTTKEQTKSPRLPDDRRLIVATDPPGEAAGRGALFAPGGPLTREQLDLVDVLGSTLGVDALLPVEPIPAEGGQWKIDAPAMGRLLGLDRVGFCDVTAVVDETNPRYARFQLAGALHGVVDGAATEIDLRGIGLFSLKKKRLTQLNLAVREERGVGPATPGFRGVAKARIKVRPLDGEPNQPAPAAELTASPARRLERATPGEALLIADAREAGFRLRHDRRWFAAGEDRRSLVLRRVDGENLAARATFTIGESAAEPSLEAFESLVRSSLGSVVQSIEASEQWTNRAGCRCMGVVARGEAGGAPVEWRYYRAAGPAGSATANRHVTLAASIEPGADADAAAATRRLIDTLEIAPPAAAATASRNTAAGQR